MSTPENKVKPNPKVQALIVGDRSPGTQAWLDKLGLRSIDDVQRKSVTTPDGQNFNLAVSNGVGRYAEGQPYRGKQTVIVVYDAQDPKSFNNVKEWLRDIDRYGTDDVHKVIVGVNNGNPNLPNQVSDEVAKRFAEENSCTFFEVDANETPTLDHEMFQTAVPEAKVKKEPIDLNAPKQSRVPFTQRATGFISKLIDRARDFFTPQTKIVLDEPPRESVEEIVSSFESETEELKGQEQEQGPPKPPEPKATTTATSKDADVNSSITESTVSNIESEEMKSDIGSESEAEELKEQETEEDPELRQIQVEETWARPEMNISALKSQVVTQMRAEQANPTGQYEILNQVYQKLEADQQKIEALKEKEREAPFSDNEDRQSALDLLGKYGGKDTKAILQGLEAEVNSAATAKDTDVGASITEEMESGLEAESEEQEEVKVEPELEQLSDAEAGWQKAFEQNNKRMSDEPDNRAYAQIADQLLEEHEEITQLQEATSRGELTEADRRRIDKLEERYHGDGTQNLERLEKAQAQVQQPTPPVTQTKYRASLFTGIVNLLKRIGLIETPHTELKETTIPMPQIGETSQQEVEAEEENSRINDNVDSEQALKGKDADIELFNIGAKKADELLRRATILEKRGAQALKPEEKARLQQFKEMSEADHEALSNARATLNPSIAKLHANEYAPQVRRLTELESRIAAVEKVEEKQNVKVKPVESYVEEFNKQTDNGALFKNLRAMSANPNNAERIAGNRSALQELRRITDSVPLRHRDEFAKLVGQSNSALGHVKDAAGLEGFLKGSAESVEDFQRKLDQTNASRTAEEQKETERREAYMKEQTSQISAEEPGIENESEFSAEVIEVAETVSRKRPLPDIPDNNDAKRARQERADTGAPKRAPPVFNDAVPNARQSVPIQPTQEKVEVQVRPKTVPPQTKSVQDYNEDAQRKMLDEDLSDIADTDSELRDETVDEFFDRIVYEDLPPRRSSPEVSTVDSQDIDNMFQELDDLLEEENETGLEASIPTTSPVTEELEMDLADTVEIDTVEMKDIQIEPEAKKPRYESRPLPPTPKPLATNTWNNVKQGPPKINVIPAPDENSAANQKTPQDPRQLQVPKAQYGHDRKSNATVETTAKEWKGPRNRKLPDLPPPEINAPPAEPSARVEPEKTPQDRTRLRVGEWDHTKRQRADQERRREWRLPQRNDASNKENRRPPVDRSIYNTVSAEDLAEKVAKAKVPPNYPAPSPPTKVEPQGPSASAAKPVVNEERIRQRRENRSERLNALAKEKQGGSAERSERHDASTKEKQSNADRNAFKQSYKATEATRKAKKLTAIPSHPAPSPPKNAAGPGNTGRN